jgi:Zn-dependent protease
MVDSLLTAVYLAAALAVGLIAHEFAHARVADALGDASPRRWGWLSLDPRRKVDPFGTLILPLLILVPWAAAVWFVPPFAYAKPMPFEPTALRDGRRGPIWVAVAGPLANLGLAAAAGVAIRGGLGGQVGVAALALVYANAVLCVFNLLPVPGLDGARLLSRVLPPKAREAFTNLEHYLPLFMLVIYFLIAGPLLGVVQGLSNVVCRALAGANCV